MLLALSTAGAARAAEAAPRQGPDILRTELVIRPDIAERKLSVEATLEIANPEMKSTFTFLLADWYSSVTVGSRSGPAVVERKEGAIEVKVSRPAHRERLLFQLAGTPGKSSGEARPVIDDDSVFLLWSDRFYPADFDDWTILQTRVELPETFRVLAPGCRTTRIAPDGSRIEVFETSQPIRAATILADTRWIATERFDHGRMMRTLLHPGSRQLAENVLTSSAEVLEFYESRFGPYVFDEFTFATVEGIYARRAVAGGVIYSPEYLDREMRAIGHDAHETALLWWFYTAAGSGPGSYQWTEGFGDYAEILYDDLHGLRPPGIFESFRLGYMTMAGTDEEPPITAANRGPRWANYVHGRLPWLMHLLRFVVGDTAYDRAQRLLFDRWRFRTFTLEQFVATLAEGTEQSLDWWRKEWLERRGVPELAWKSETARDGTGFRVTVKIRQKGNVYRLPLEISIDTSEGKQLELVRLDGPSGEFRFHCRGEPGRVVIDPRRWILSKITPE